MDETSKNSFIIEVEGFRALVQRKKVRRITMTIKPPDGRVCITMPQNVSVSVARRFMKSKLEWIAHKQLECIRSAQAAPDASTGRVLLWGQPVPLSVVTGAHRCSAALEDGQAVLYVTDDSAAQRQELLEELFRAQLQERLPEIIEKWERITGAHATGWQLRRMKTRWGSCTTNTGRIRLNTRLAMLPPECLEYVVAHELCHLHEPSHNARFYRLMDGFFPGWRDVRARMKEMSGAAGDCPLQ